MQAKKGIQAQTYVLVIVGNRLVPKLINIKIHPKKKGGKKNTNINMH